MVIKSQVLLGLAVLSSGVWGCGHNETEWRAKLAEIANLEHQLHDRTGERDHCNEQLQGLQASNESMAHRLEELGVHVNQLRQEGARTASELAAARAREEELQRRQRLEQERLATFRNMLSRFQTMISSGQLRVRVVHGRMVIQLPAGILFDSGQAALRPEGQQVLTQVAAVLHQIDHRDFLVAGHTDNVQLGRHGRFEDNWDLSTARAVNVVRFLAQNQVPTVHLGAAGYAEFQPDRPNDTDENRQLNRRVEIVLMPNLEELPDLSSLDASGGATPPAPPPVVPPAPGH